MKRYEEESIDDLTKKLKILDIEKREVLNTFNRERQLIIQELNERKVAKTNKPKGLVALDLFGEELSIGDEVLFSTAGKSRAGGGRIIKITEQTVTVLGKDNRKYWRNHNNVYLSK